MARPSPDPEDKPIPITTSIPYNQYMLCKKNGWTWKEVFLTGMGVKVNQDQLPVRITQLENQLRVMREFMTKRGYKV